MVESGGLENRCGRKPTVGSNPTSSAMNHSRLHICGSCPIPERSEWYRANARVHGKPPKDLYDFMRSALNIPLSLKGTFLINYLKKKLFLCNI